MDVDNDEIFKENPFGDYDEARTSDIFYDGSITITPVKSSVSQKEIEAMMMPSLE